MVTEAITVVLQSFRRVDVPPWLTRCLASVEQWAVGCGYAYRFVDDAIFDLLPEAYRLRAGHDLQLLADLARLLAAQRLLDEGAERVVWLDADVYVFGPLVLPEGRDFYLCRELWDRELRVNNCACVFSRGGAFLPFYIDACQQLMRAAAGKLDSLMVGTRFLTQLDRAVPLPQLASVALFGPPVLADVAAGGGPHLDAYRARFGGPVHAANLCLSFRGALGDAVYERAVDALAAGLYSSP